jgi:hypothetical protein
MATFTGFNSASGNRQMQITKLSESIEFEIRDETDNFSYFEMSCDDLIELISALQYIKKQFDNEG